MKNICFILCTVSYTHLVNGIGHDVGLVFFLTFNVVGAFLSNVMSYAIDGLTLLADRALT